MDRHALQVIVHEAELEVQAAADRALKAPWPNKKSALDFLYSPKVNPSSEQRPKWGAAG